MVATLPEYEDLSLRERRRREAEANGHTEEQEPPPEEAPTPARSCRQCGASLEGKQPTAIWCSVRCKRAAERAQPRATASPGAVPDELSHPGQLRAPAQDANSRNLVNVVRTFVTAGMAVSINVDGIELTIR